MQYNASGAEAARFVRFVSRHKQVEVVLKPSRAPWEALAGFVREHLTEAESVTYLEELDDARRLAKTWSVKPRSAHDGPSVL